MCKEGTNSGGWCNYGRGRTLFGKKRFSSLYAMGRIQFRRRNTN
uniref:ORF43d n=1 Tax=Pinus koraiensis TaxID=88728 RepID=Q85X53_PINKO|nr:ORF43d [Pinus koraiensis]